MKVTRYLGERKFDHKQRLEYWQGATSDNCILPTIYHETDNFKQTILPVFSSQTSSYFRAIFRMKKLILQLCTLHLLSSFITDDPSSEVLTRLNRLVLRNVILVSLNESYDGVNKSEQYFEAYWSSLNQSWHNHFQTSRQNNVNTSWFQWIITYSGRVLIKS